jgi:hypothetical protein
MTGMRRANPELPESATAVEHHKPLNPRGARRARMATARRLGER